MKKIIRLTESDLARIVKRVIKEQSILSMPDLGQDVVGLTKMGSNKCLKYKEDPKIVLSLFYNSRKSSGQPSQNDQKIKNWVTRIYNSTKSSITSDFTKVLSEIKTPQEFGAVLLGYETKFKKPLYQVINGKVKDWKSIKNSLGKIKGSLNIDFCETYSNPNTQET